MQSKALFITPPFTQLNTAYPATAYLKGFLEIHDISMPHCDLSIELFTAVFKSDFLRAMFKEAKDLGNYNYPEVSKMKSRYISCVDPVIAFLQKHDIETAQSILKPDFLPPGHRLKHVNTKIEWEAGDIGVIDKAKHHATLFIEEIGDFIQANVDEFFAFTKYAEQIATSASSFDQIDEFLSYQPTLIEEEMLDILVDQIKTHQPNLVCFTIPFPGNLFAALRCAQFIKQLFPDIYVAFGGGYCNTELRALEDPRIFEFVDFISLDDGEGPLLKMINYLDGKIDINQLERTFVLENNKVVYKNKTPNTIYHHKNLPAPNYSGLPFDKYVSFLDVVNPMHRMWTDARWNKLTISHGCYWKQCSFCDVSLDYIGNYQNTTAEDLVNKIEKIIKDTGITGFHFVDEAAPPKMLRALSKALIERNLKITWWTNIRFEKTFSFELCELMAQSGCIAVTGGLEVASDRLLSKMKKGVDIAQVARVTHHFSENNIMVHAYLMYGFPTQTEQETIDSLEVVRQLFQKNCIQSAFWHQFTTTIHSPIGQNPEAFGIEITGPVFQGFAQNDLYHKDAQGANHPKYTKGLNLALHNYLNSAGLQDNLQNWFDFPIPPTSHPDGLIESFLEALTVK
ncbi:B12-binding domain-containing radical SAM protein [Algibacter miyuki]|uniref:B12-binding domain-containing radical SAM protein n=1 Tax=Algibacter miyuki TaxID=1306933 RepID=A0ABV5H2W0_9FLAO|nr:radical SAM protein [Algibacter miyuki]MDN3666418.1 radical SAM protein [Algibacter miyuki]